MSTNHDPDRQWAIDAEELIDGYPGGPAYVERHVPVLLQQGPSRLARSDREGGAGMSAEAGLLAGSTVQAGTSRWRAPVDATLIADKNAEIRRCLAEMSRLADVREPVRDEHFDERLARVISWLRDDILPYTRDEEAALTPIATGGACSAVTDAIHLDHVAMHRLLDELEAAAAVADGS
ncbi:MAG: hemerythrin domain-containing protein, partial [Candidatus Dormibacteria bacterium]